MFFCFKVATNSISAIRETLITDLVILSANIEKFTRVSIASRTLEALGFSISGSVTCSEYSSVKNSNYKRSIIETIMQESHLSGVFTEEA